MMDSGKITLPLLTGDEQNSSTVTTAFDWSVCIGSIILDFAKYLVNDNDHNIKCHEKRKHNIDF